MMRSCSCGISSRCLIVELVLDIRKYHLNDIRMALKDSNDNRRQVSSPLHLLDKLENIIAKIDLPVNHLFLLLNISVGIHYQPVQRPDHHRSHDYVGRLSQSRKPVDQRLQLDSPGFPCCLQRYCAEHARW